jgi:hypothetical protein
MPETAPAVRLSSDELLAEVRRALLETGQAADVEEERRAARALGTAVRALDDRMSAHGEQPAAWGGDCWTVLGVWRGSDPVPIGVIRGSHPVKGETGRSSRRACGRRASAATPSRRRRPSL